MKYDGLKGYTLDIDATGIEADKQSAKMTYKGFTGYMPMVGHVAENAFAQTSFGERQRALIARAMMAEPELLILDEPCAGLDISGREVLLDGLDAMMRENGRTSLVLVTHHIEEITPGFTHALILRDGCVLAAGPKDEVLRDDMLGEAFGLAIRVDRHDGRYWPRVGR